MANELLPTPDEIRAIELIVKNAVDSKYFDKQGGLPGAFSIAMFAREMGLPIMSSLFGGIGSVMGRVQIAPQMMNAMIRKGGHTLRTLEHTDEICKLYGKRKDTGEEMTVSFSIEDSKRAGIYKNGGPWQTRPRNMTYKSALANLARWLFADVIGMAMVEGEIEEKDDDEGIDKKADNAMKTIEPPPELTDIEIIGQFESAFKSIENADLDLDSYILHISEKTRKTLAQTMKQAIKNADKFKNSYLKWVEDQKPVVDPSPLEGSKEMTLV